MNYRDGKKVDCGDVVALTHGGCKMTVCEVGIHGMAVDTVRCMWFDTDNHLQERLFAVSSLQFIR